MIAKVEQLLKKSIKENKATVFLQLSTKEVAVESVVAGARGTTVCVNYVCFLNQDTACIILVDVRQMAFCFRSWSSPIHFLL